MSLSLPRRPALLGLTLASTTAFAVGASVALATRATSDAPPAAHVQAMDSQVGDGLPSATSASVAAPTTEAPGSAQATPKPRPRPLPRTAQTLTLPQAAAMASKLAHARLDKIEVKNGSQGHFFEVELTRRDGTDVEVIVRGNTARVTKVDRDHDESTRTSRAALPLTLSQAAALATKRAAGSLDKIEVKDGLRGPYYKVELTRRDGTDVDVIVQGRTARVTDVDRDSDDTDDGD